MSPQFFFVNGRQYTREELNAKRKAGIVSSVKTPKKRHQGISKSKSAAGLATDIRLKMADLKIPETPEMKNFLESESTTVAELEAFLNDETNFFIGGAAATADKEEETPEETPEEVASVDSEPQKKEKKSNKSNKSK